MSSQALPKESLTSYSARRINTLLAAMSGSHRYLEVGVETGHTFFEVSAAFKTAVDPQFLFELEAAQTIHPDWNFFQITSDQFFQGNSIDKPYDVVFLDGLHTWDQTYRDFCNSLLITHERSVIVLDDIFPCDVFSCNRDQLEGTMMRRMMTGDPSNLWHGDTYKVIPLIQIFHPTLSYCTIITDGNPQALVWRSREPMEPPFDIINSQGSLNMSDLDYLWFLRNQDRYNLMPETEALELVTASLR
jgi:hypothetical protein